MKARDLQLVQALLLAMGIILLSVTQGCKKKEKENPDVSLFQEAAEDNARAEGEQNFLSDAVDNQGETSDPRRVAGTDSAFLPPCARVSYDANTRRLTIDFGPTNCLCRDGVYRRGKVYVTFSGPQWLTAGSRAYVTTDSFFVNDNQHIVEKILFNEGINQAGERVIRDTVQLHKVITPNGTHQWSATRTYRQIQGQSTWMRWDDIWLIEGNAQGTTRRGNSYTIQILSPLKVVGSCIFRVPVKGIWQLNTQNRTVKVNYDPYNNEACDRVASVQVDNQNPVNITLR